MHLLMCSPDYYGIEYEINPWMSRDRQSDRQRAQEQWDGLYRLLKSQLAAEIEIIEPQAALPDMVFTANGGLAWNGKFIVSNFRHAVRRAESKRHELWFKDHGYSIHRLPEDCVFEGEGDLLRCGRFWFAGYHIRSDIQSHQKVAEILQQEILSLELVSDWFYHLDTCFCPLGEGKAVYCPDAFDSYARTVLEHHVPELIPVLSSDAERFACNAIVRENKIVMNEGCRAIRERLEELGFTVLETPLDEFIKAGGSAKCLVLNLG
jgi:N-dimethylarginine dimethylaminohydrolase